MQKDSYFGQKDSYFGQKDSYSRQFFFYEYYNILETRHGPVDASTSQQIVRCKLRRYANRWGCRWQRHRASHGEPTWWTSRQGDQPSRAKPVVQRRAKARKIDPWGSPGLLKSTQNRARERPGEPRSAQGAPRHDPERLRCAPGAPRERPESPKKCPCEKQELFRSAPGRPEARRGN